MYRAISADTLTSPPIFTPPQGEDARADALVAGRVSDRASAIVDIAVRATDDNEPAFRGDIVIQTECRRRRVGRAGRAMHGVGAVAGSLIVHSAAVAAMFYLATVKHSEWILPLHRGKQSVALAASMAAPPPSSDEPVTVERPEPTPPSPTEPEPLDAEPMSPLMKQAVNRVEQPSAAFADLKEDQRQPPAPISETRAEVESPEPSEDRLTEHPKRTSRAVRQALPRELTASTTMESVAASASAADSGVVADQPPAVVHTVEPIYPAESLAAREHGIVKLRIKVDSQGHVVAASLNRSSGFPRLDQAALDAIQEHRFAPADGSTTGRAAEFVWPITFRLKVQPVRR